MDMKYATRTIFFLFWLCFCSRLYTMEFCFQPLDIPTTLSNSPAHQTFGTILSLASRFLDALSTWSFPIYLTVRDWFLLAIYLNTPAVLKIRTAAKSQRIQSQPASNKWLLERELQYIYEIFILRISQIVECLIVRRDISTSTGFGGVPMCLLFKRDILNVCYFSKTSSDGTMLSISPCQESGCYPWRSHSVGRYHGHWSQTYSVRTASRIQQIKL